MLDLGITAFGNDLVAAWRGFATDEHLYYSSFDGSGWSAPTVIPGVSSSWGPSLTVFNGRLYAAWKGFATDEHLWYSSFDGSSWAPQASIPGVSSSIGPSLTVFNGRLYAAWKGFATDEQLYYSSFDGSSWAPQAQIPGHSFVGPSLAGFGGRLYAAWRGSGTDQHLWYSSFDGSNWAPQTQIPVGLGSSMGPTLRVGFGDRLYVAYKGADNDTNIGYTSFDGSTWAPAARLTTMGSYVGASLAVFNGRLYAAWRTTLNDAGQQQLDYSSFDGSNWASPAGIPGTVTNISPPPTPLPPTGPYTYGVDVGAGGVPVLAQLTVSFGDVQFTGLYWGLTFGYGHSHGTAWLNYDVHWLAQQNWSARFEFAGAPDEVGVRFWGLSGENIGSLRAGGMGVGALAGGQGTFHF